jgi:hypothetical protein
MVREVVVQSPGMDTRSRREREGCAHVAGEEEKWDGEEKGARRRWGTLLSERGEVGDGPWEAPRGDEEWGGAWGPARWSSGVAGR